MLDSVSGTTLLAGILGAFQTRFFQRLFSGLSVFFPHAHTVPSLPQYVFLNSVHKILVKENLVANKECCSQALMHPA